MAGIRITELGQSIAYGSVPWAKKPVSLKRESFPKGSVPPHLRQYLLQRGGDAAACAAETRGLKGAARVQAMNACISARRGRRRLGA